ncbi:hypothetical protein CTI12_AA027970 [Artemisia annua]|uniref:BYPASS-related protein n=1 Tax=Artemisia annua TaxID=35608 RepID=A0A2U1QEY7_ARTAN|nr:hypothetical protein CTI12_AA027970 [Artemisia annua]
MSKAVTFLTTINTAAYNQIVQIHSFRSDKKFESDLMTSYMDYSLKVLELCNLMTSSVKEMTERKMLMKLALRLVKSGDVAPEKMKKGKEVLRRCVECTRARGDDERCSRAKVLIGEVSSGACKLPVGEVSNEAGVVRRTLHALGALTVVISNVLVTVLYGQSEIKEHRVTNEFGWANSVNSVQQQIVDQVNAKSLLTEIEDTNRLAVNVCDVIDDVIGNGNEEQRVRLEKVVKEYEETVVRYCDGVDELTNGVNGLFNGVMKTRNGVLDGVRKVTLSWMSKAVTFLTTIHTAAYNQIHSFRSDNKFESDLMTSYMDYSLKVLELCNLMTSSVKEMTERKMLMKLALRLVKSGDVAPEKMKKTKEVLRRCVECTRARGDDERCLRAKVLIGEVSSGACKLPVGEVSNEAGVVRRTLHALGALTVVVSNVLVSVLYGQSEIKEHRVTNEFSWADSVNSVQKQIVDQVNAKSLLTEIEDTNRLAVNVCDVIDDVISNGYEEQRVRLEKVVKEYEETVVRYCDGVDELTNGVNGLFNGVMKTRNGVLDGVRKGRDAASKGPQKRITSPKN